MDKYLLYQPMHGMAVELHILETLFHLGRILGRVVVLPEMPVLESTTYKKGLEEYFNVPKTFPWITTKEFKKITGGKIDMLFHIFPEYRPEYQNALVRALHPTWLTLILECSYFKSMAFEIENITRCYLNEKLSQFDILNHFHLDVKAIAISYVNGILRSDFFKENETLDEFEHHVSVPPSPREEYMDVARKFMGESSYAAVHWRRGANAEIMARSHWNITLPKISEFYELLPPNLSTIYLASDIPGFAFEPPGRKVVVKSFDCDEPNDRAVIDLCCCILASYFIGNYFSTFSVYIFHARKFIGHPKQSSILL